MRGTPPLRVLTTARLLTRFFPILPAAHERGSPLVEAYEAALAAHLDGAGRGRTGSFWSRMSFGRKDKAAAGRMRSALGGMWVATHTFAAWDVLTQRPLVRLPRVLDVDRELHGFVEGVIAALCAYYGLRQDGDMLALLADAGHLTADAHANIALARDRIADLRHRARVHNDNGYDTIW